MIKKLTGFIIFFLVFTFVNAQDVKKDKIRALFVIMRQDSLIIKSFDAMAVSMNRNMSAMFKDSAYTNAATDINKIAGKALSRNMEKSKEYALKLLNADMVDIYDKYFTEEEIDDFSIFYKSKSGQKLLDKTPEIAQDIMNSMSVKYQSELQQSIMKDFQEMATEMKLEMNKKNL